MTAETLKNNGVESFLAQDLSNKLYNRKKQIVSADETTRFKDDADLTSWLIAVLNEELEVTLVATAAKNLWESKFRRSSRYVNTTAGELSKNGVPNAVAQGLSNNLVIFINHIITTYNDFSIYNKNILFDKKHK